MIKHIITFVQNNPTITISLISLALSLYNFFYSLYIKRKKILVNFLCYEQQKTKNYFNYTFKVIIENKSQLPISITNIKINNLNCVNYSDYIIQKTHHLRKDHTEEEKFYTMQLPINLPSLVSTSGLIRIETETQIDFDNFFVQLFTNRGKIKKCKFIFHDDFSEVQDVV